MKGERATGLGKTGRKQAGKNQQNDTAKQRREKHFTASMKLSVVSNYSMWHMIGTQQSGGKQK